MSFTGPFEPEAPANWRYYLNVGIRCRWWLIASAILVWAFALMLSLWLPAKYRSETLVLVEPGGAPAQYVTPNLSLDLQQRLQSLAEQTLSRPRLVKLITDFHLYGHVDGGPVSDGVVKEMRGDISVELTKAGTNGDISAFKIIYTGASPKTAQQVTSVLSSLFIEDSLDRQQRLSDDTTSFLSTQLEEARQDMTVQANLLRQFRSANLGELPEQRAANMQILAGLQDRLRSATESLHQAEKQKLYLGSMIGWNGTGEAPATVSSPLDEQIEKMKVELERLSTQYTPLHPDVVHLRDRIAAAENQKKALAAKDATGRPGRSAAIQDGPRAISPLAELQSQFKATELEITNRKQEIGELERQIELYQSRLNRAPITEQQVTEANRNFEQAQNHYEALLSKKQQSEMATDLSKKQQNAQFRILDPPTLPERPYWPNRLKFSAIGLFFGIVLGCAGIVLKEVFDARVLGEDDLVRWAQIPVLGIVPPLITNDEKKGRIWRHSFEAAAVSILVLAVPVLTIVISLKS